MLPCPPTTGVALSGNVVVDTLVAQGRRPVGELMRVTRCEGNILYELDGRPAFEAVQQLFATLDEYDRRLAGTALFVGVLMDEFRDEPRVGDFLIRQPHRRGSAPRVPRRRGIPARGDARPLPPPRCRYLRRGPPHHAEGLREDLPRDPLRSPPSSPVSDAGGGSRRIPNFDTGVFREYLGDVPVGGFFCNGEMGPYGGNTFLHGYTSSFGLFRPRTPA